MIVLIYPSKTRNSLSYVQRARIQSTTRNDELSYRVILKERLSYTKDVLYSARRKLLRELRDEVTSLFLEKL